MSLFPPPARLETTVFASVPERFRVKRRTVWGDINKGGEAVDSFLEGPSFDRGGNLWVVDIAHGRIFRIAPDGGDWTLMAEYDGEPNGLKIHKDGRIFITDYKNGLMILEPTTGKVTSLLERRSSERFKGLNDLFFSANGGLATDWNPDRRDDAGNRIPAYGIWVFVYGTLVSSAIAMLPSLASSR